MTRDVLLYVPHGGWIRAEFMTSAFAALADPDGPVAELREMHCGPVMGQARNTITQNWLASPYEWLLMADSDMVFTPATIRKIREAADPVGRPVVGALCWTFADGGRIATVYRRDKDDAGRFGFTNYDDVPDDEVIQVDATGAAFLLLHRSVITRLEEREPQSRGLWWAELAVDGRLFGEDFSFCVRCIDAGIPVHVRTGARTGHVKTIVLGAAE